MFDCGCDSKHPDLKRIVVTGGPGAGKTALLEVVARSLCRHVAVLPEAAAIVHRGGFPRRGESLNRAAERAIFHVQDELERAFEESGNHALILCDRGALDGLAHWPGGAERFFEELGQTREALLARYALVVHLRTPRTDRGRNHRNPLRTEDTAEARALDERVLAAWAGHPRRLVMETSDDFVGMVNQALERIRAELPDCCLRR